MEELDNAQARRVWQRVMGEAPEGMGWLDELIQRQSEDAALYRQLARKQGGRYEQLWKRKHEQLCCLRGIRQIRAGSELKPQPSGKLPDRVSAQLLRRCAARELADWKVLDAKTRDPEFGPVFAALRERQGELCRLVLELLGAMPGR